MVETKFPGYEWILFISTDEGTTWKPVACLESNDMSNSNSPIDTTSKCDDGESSSIPGPTTWTMSGSGFSIDDRGLSKASFLALYKLYKTKTTVGLRFAKKNTGVSDYYFHGKGFMTSLNQTADGQDSVKFDVEFQGIGALNIGGSY